MKLQQMMLIILRTSIIDLGVIVLSNEEKSIEKDGEKIRVIGIEDPLNGVSVADALSRF